MVEIAICLAVIGFALVAIIGILPTGMQVQKENRQETIINQDATFFLDAIRNGAQGLDDLTNYVTAITNEVFQYASNGKWTGNVWRYGYKYASSSMSPPYLLTNGFRIVGLLSTPKYVPWSVPKGGDGYYSNHVVAYVRSLSGPASEKFPQTNASVQDLGFSYRVLSEVVPCGTNYYDPSWTNYTAFQVNSPDYVAHYNYSMLTSNLQANLHDVRLTFRWPLLDQRGKLGPGGQVFRTLIGGCLLQTNEVPSSTPLERTLFFFEPRTYVKAP